jgi:hypothetical protein
VILASHYWNCNGSRGHILTGEFLYLKPFLEHTFNYTVYHEVPLHTNIFPVGEPTGPVRLLLTLLVSLQKQVSYCMQEVLLYYYMFKTQPCNSCISAALGLAIKELRIHHSGKKKIQQLSIYKDSPLQSYILICYIIIID